MRNIKKIIYLISSFVLIFVLCIQNGTTYATDVGLVNEVTEEPGITTKQNSTNLETLAIENTLLYPAFDNSVTKYEAEVSNSTINLNILAIPENENAKAEIVWNKELKEGNNLIIINVTAVDGVAKKVYEVNVYKRNKEEETVYEQEQEENRKRLEEIYNSENVSSNATTVERMSKNSQVETKSNGLMIVLAIIIVALAFLLVFGFFKVF